MDNKVVDFVSISESLTQFGLQSPKLCIRLWESLKKKLKDLYKRENEFQTLCRNEVSVEFWTETTRVFKQRIRAYEKALSKRDRIDIEVFRKYDLEKDHDFSDESDCENPVKRFQKEEDNF